MNKLLPLFFVLSFCQALSGEELTPNLVKDGGFENWKEILPGGAGWEYLTVRNQGWKLSRNEQGGKMLPEIFDQLLGKTGTLMMEEKEAHGGKRCLRLCGSLYLKKAETYDASDRDIFRVTFWIMGEGEAAIHFATYGEGRYGYEIVRRSGKPRNDCWTRIEQDILVFGKGVNSILPRMVTSAEMLVDDISIRRVLREEASGEEVEPSCAERVIFAPPAAMTPVIDGSVDENAWEEAVSFGGFRSVCSQARLSAIKSSVRMMFDDKNIYFALEIELPDCEKTMADLPPLLKAGGTAKAKRDTYTDRHSIELFLQPPGSSTYYQYVISPDGYFYDGNSQDKAAWNSGASHAVQIRSDRWFLEMKLPASDFNLPAIVKGKEWRINITRNLDGNYSTWNDVGYNFHNPLAFGKMITQSFGEWQADRQNGISAKLGLLAMKVTAYPEFDKRIKTLADYLCGISFGEGRDWKSVTRCFSAINYLGFSCQCVEREMEFAGYAKPVHE
jgi:hypothetical protein